MKSLFVFTPIECILVGVTGGLFLIQLLYWLVTYGRPLRKSRKVFPQERGEQHPVSVVVYAKNESENLQKHLPVLLSQDYPAYEVIVVNDGSTDESDDVLKTFEQEYAHLYHTYIPEDVKYLSRKKLALTVGIKAAKNDILLFIEANCEPLSKEWISSVVNAYKPETEIVLGFCAYAYKKGFLHKLIAYDNLIGGLQYLSPALIRRPFAGNGRNLSYRKELFFQHKGYYKSLSLHAGDDDLFVNESASRKNTEAVYCPESITQMSAISNFKVWREMKASRAATQQHYRGGRLLFYRLEDLSYFFFLFAVIITIGVGLYANWLISLLAGLLFVFRYVAKAIVLHKSCKLLQQRPTTGLLFLLEFLHPLFNLYIRVYRLFRGKNDYTFRLG
ncbi:glycosyltransferase [Parabacteroides sp. 52]|uniref:glycosyltransferase n=1 Tax=unclassified Parabacteroides TaxID=2649774 RepID=UPI0013D6FC99|nr:MULTISPECIES: glycosyltransferase [unclassified Parabacteroides]MDH6534552.1 glycosyltransferase involved in cell wall biosynthesis [Parabacteroides sp. PM5-20]NDV55212.1 glycosyltransferase [Parabacteroides sp. 52]